MHTPEKQSEASRLTGAQVAEQLAEEMTRNKYSSRLQPLRAFVQVGGGRVFGLRPNRGTGYKEIVEFVGEEIRAVSPNEIAGEFVKYSERAAIRGILAADESVSLDAQLAAKRAELDGLQRQINEAIVELEETHAELTATRADLKSERAALEKLRAAAESNGQHREKSNYYDLTTPDFIAKPEIKILITNGLRQIATRLQPGEPISRAAIQRWSPSMERQLHKRGLLSEAGLRNFLEPAEADQLFAQHHWTDDLGAWRAEQRRKKREAQLAQPALNPEIKREALLDTSTAAADATQIPSEHAAESLLAALGKDLAELLLIADRGETASREKAAELMQKIRALAERNKAKVLETYEEALEGQDLGNKLLGRYPNLNALAAIANGSFRPLCQPLVATHAPS